MAKVSFTKLGLKVNQEIKTIKWNGQIIDIKQYIPVSDKLVLMSNVINLSYDTQTNFSNHTKIDVYTKLNIVEAYTNINFTDKQKENVCKLYDLFVSSGLMELILSNIPQQEINEITVGIEQSVKALYAYQNSAMGILDVIKSDYSNLDLDATMIQEKIANPENLSLLKDIIDKLG